MNVAIYGYGNLGRGVEAAIKYNPDMTLFGVFTRRDPASVATASKDTRVYHASELLSHKHEIDVLIICGGSATDLPEMTPTLAESFNVVDSFDTHAKIPEHFRACDAVAKRSGKIALISAGWDPGLFSIARLYASASLPEGKDYTFWGKGISQGHSDAIRRIEGVIDARQYTVPIETAIGEVRAGKCPELTTGEKHLRECYVVAAEGSDKHRIETEIKTMPNYFADYNTSVTFVTLEELKRDHRGMPHGGSVIRNGVTGLSGDNSHTVEFSLRLDSNPEFTGSVLVAYARAVKRMHDRGESGCRTVLDVAPSDLSIHSREELYERLL